MLRGWIGLLLGKFLVVGLPGMNRGNFVLFVGDKFYFLEESLEGQIDFQARAEFSSRAGSGDGLDGKGDVLRADRESDLEEIRQK